MSPNYFCPRCKAKNIIDHVEYIECLECSMDFFKSYIGKIDDENVLAEQELKDLTDIFEDLKGKKNQDRVFKIFRKI